MSVAIAVILGCWVIGLLIYNWVLRTALREAWDELENVFDNYDKVWQWVVNANGRRKRVERYLRKQQAKYRQLSAEHRDLAAHIVDEILTGQDRELVTQSLTRRIK